MQVIMNNNMKKRLDSTIDLCFVGSGNGTTQLPYRDRYLRVIPNGFAQSKLWVYFGVYSFTDITFTQSKSILKNGKSHYRHELSSSGTRKFTKIEVTYKSNGAIVFTETIDMATNLVSSNASRFSTDVGNNYHQFGIGKDQIVEASDSALIHYFLYNSSYHISVLNYPKLTKTSYKNGTPYNRASVKGTTTGDVRVSLIPPLDWQPAVTGVTLDSFEIKFYDDADRLTAIVTGTIGDLNSTADVKMANPTPVDGSFVNISGMDDFLIKMPNTLELTV